MADSTITRSDRKHALNDNNLHTGITGTQGNLLALDSNGLPTDSGTKPSDFSAGNSKKTYTQATHGFGAGEAIRHNGTSWVKAQADSAANAEAVGVVESVSGDDFTVVFNGAIECSGTSWTTGANFLDPTTAGGLTTTKPTTSGSIIKPLLTALSATTGVVNICIGFEND